MFGWMGIKRVHAVSRCEMGIQSVPEVSRCEMGTQSDPGVTRCDMGTQTFQDVPVGLQMVRKVPKVKEVPKVPKVRRVPEVRKVPDTITFTDYRGHLVEVKPLATWEVILSVLLVLIMIGFDIRGLPQPL